MVLVTFLMESRGVGLKFTSGRPDAVVSTVSHSLSCLKASSSSRIRSSSVVLLILCSLDWAK